MKIVSCALALAVVGTASASYELMFATDRVGQKINRYDAISGAYLGSFGQGFSASFSRMTPDPATGTLYVGDNSSERILKFNYNTGEFMGFIPTTGYNTYQCLRLSDGSFVVGGEQTTYGHFSSTGVKLDTFSYPVTVLGLTQASNGFVYAVGFNGQIYRTDVSNTSVSLVTTIPGSPVSIGIKAQGNTLAITSYDDAVRTTVFTVKADGTFGSTLGSIDLGSGNANILVGREVAFGHNGLIYTLVEDLTAQKNYAVSYHYATTKVIRQMDLGINGNGVGCLGLSTIVAPEPSTWAAMGLGLLFVARRRKAA